MLESAAWGTAQARVLVLLEGRVGYRDLREFIARLEKEGEFCTTSVISEVDPLLEITEVVQRMCRPKNRGGGHRQGGEATSAETREPVLPVPNKALLFERPKGSRIPLLINAFGSVRRMCLALEVNDLDEIAQRIQGCLSMETPQGLFDKIKLLPKLSE